MKDLPGWKAVSLDCGRDVMVDDPDLLVALPAFMSPVLLGYIVDATKGNYDVAFLFLMGSILVSSALALRLPSEIQSRAELATLG